MVRLEVETDSIWLTWSIEPLAIWILGTLKARSLEENFEKSEAIWLEQVESSNQLELPDGPKTVEVEWMEVWERT